MQQESSSSSGIFKLLDPASSSASIAGAAPSADAANNGNGTVPEQDSRRKRNLNYRFHFLESDEDDMLSAGSSVTADRSTGAATASGVDDNTQSSAAAAGKFGRYREDNNCIKF